MENGKKVTRLTVIEGGHSPKAEMQYDGAERVTCHVCEQLDGVDTIEFIPIHTKVVRKGNDMIPVITRMACACCWLKGRKTYII